jgi:hypothetical protein
MHPNRATFTDLNSFRASSVLNVFSIALDLLQRYPRNTHTECFVLYKSRIGSAG